MNLLTCTGVIKMQYFFIYSQTGKDTPTKKKHYHNNRIEIIQFKKGRGNLLINDRIFRFSEGDVFMYDASVPHCTSPDNNVDYCRNVLMFEKDIVSRLTNKIKFNIRFNADEDTNRKIDELFLNIKKYAKKDEYEIFVISEILKMIHICSRSENNIEPITGGTAFKVIQMISDTSFSQCSLDEISKSLHLSKYHMCRKFKEETGITIYAYIKAQKIVMAKKLLMETDKSISDIAYELSFADTACFTRAFKLETGLSPSQFRKSGE